MLIDSTIKLSWASVSLVISALSLKCRSFGKRGLGVARVIKFEWRPLVGIIPGAYIFITAACATNSGSGAFASCVSVYSSLFLRAPPSLRLSGAHPGQTGSQPAARALIIIYPAQNNGVRVCTGIQHTARVGRKVGVCVLDYYARTNGFFFRGTCFLPK